MAKKVYNIDRYRAATARGKPLSIPMVAIVRRQLPYADDNGCWHRGTGKGINTLFGKNVQALSGKDSATISANTAICHAVFYTDPEDWVEETDYVVGLTEDQANYYRFREGMWIENVDNEIFIGNFNHILGTRVGLKRPVGSALKVLMEDLMPKDVRARIRKMTLPAERTHGYNPDTLLTDQEVTTLVKRATDRNPVIINVSDLFIAVTALVLTKI